VAKRFGGHAGLIQRLVIRVPGIGLSFGAARRFAPRSCCASTFFNEISSYVQSLRVAALPYFLVDLL
jgi:hypothetical protein